MMKDYYVDLHIHIGRTHRGRAVKITGARSLTLQNVLKTASERKGLDMVGIIDCHSPEVIEELELLIDKEEMVELEEGGLKFGQTVLILGSEIEIYDQYCQGPIHVLVYMPTLDAMKELSAWMMSYMKNIHLSSQRIYCEGITLQEKTKELGGLFIPAHVFTPFKSLYGKGVEFSLTEVFNPNLIDGIELGLSSDTTMAREINELDPYVFLTNSDAHSLAKIAREYQKMELKQPSFLELEKALKEVEGRKIAVNYGLNPELGKYHQTVCRKCLQPGAVGSLCSVCGSKSIINGVANRIKEIAGLSVEKSNRSRPAYVHQVPLDFIPGLGPKTFERLLAVFGTEMNILHEVTVNQLQQVVPEKTAVFIDLARKGLLTFTAGGGGKYGKIKST
ncbi:TIGR00375 family protein [Peribacillus psychrosaccharolyticus]|uniref:TIGR00375 family protein n=1 Tax=Peribacillus psychrosaccharolyticus TaxID=1407 RepID=A0A974NLM9_PERPY|nr:endonuclease Q family protein [Peribacillus psychrosaccharolyticus]MEC2056797.1 endonuclease Q family protein [Peribacillus psychrosaccharolyticus]MED3746251.1 endonuclease Q family protein [Peribacillus psychrosaccharolyticus]QQT00080.1 TIGR00375 family protein [Peribacillus psychrosaccharolyticus]